MIFWLNWRLCDLDGTLCYSVAVDSMVVVGCEVVGVGLVDFGVMAFELDSSFVWSWVV